MSAQRRTSQAKIKGFLDPKKSNLPTSLLRPSSRTKMAVPVAGTSKFSLSDFSLKFSRLFSSKKIWIVLVVLIGLVTCVVFNLYKITGYAYRFNDVSGCVTEEVLDTYLKEQAKYMWSPWVLDKNLLYSKYPCLKQIEFGWNPLKFQTLQVDVVMEIPVVKVVIMRIDEPNTRSNVQAMYSSPVIGEEVWYFTKQGKLIKLSEDQSLYTFRLRVFKDKSIDQIRLASDFLVALFQVKQFFEKEYGFTPYIDVTSDGSAKVQTNFSEELYLSLKKDLSSQLGALQLFLARSRIEKRKLHLVDVRFLNPVVQYTAN